MSVLSWSAVLMSLENSGAHLCYKSDDTFPNWGYRNNNTVKSMNRGTSSHAWMKTCQKKTLANIIDLVFSEEIIRYYPN